MKKIIICLFSLLLLSSCAKNEVPKESPAKDVKLTNAQSEIIKNVIDVLPKEDGTYDASKISNQEKLHLAFALMRKEHTDYDIFVTKKYPMNKNNMTSSFQKYFGNVDITMEDYKCAYCEGGVVYKYNEKTGKFSETSHGHGYYALINHNEIISTKEKDGIYYVEVVRIFAAPEGDFYINHPTKLYTTEKDAYDDKNVIMDIENSNYCAYNEYQELDCDLEKVAQENYDKFKKYIYEFKYVDENLIFKGYKAA